MGIILFFGAIEVLSHTFFDAYTLESFPQRNIYQSERVMNLSTSQCSILL